MHDPRTGVDLKASAEMQMLPFSPPQSPGFRVKRRSLCLDLISKFCEMTLKFFKSKTQTNPSGLVQRPLNALEEMDLGCLAMREREPSPLLSRGEAFPQCLSLESCDRVEDLRGWLGYKSGGNKRASSLQSEWSVAPVGVNYSLLWHPEVDP